MMQSMFRVQASAYNKTMMLLPWTVSTRIFFIFRYLLFCKPPILALRDPSESEEIPNRESNLSSHEDDLIENQRNEEGMQDDESDNDFTFNDAETESDSDDNQSNQDTQRNVQPGAAVGSETGKTIYFVPQWYIFY